MWEEGLVKSFGTRPLCHPLSPSAGSLPKCGKVGIGMSCLFMRATSAPRRVLVSNLHKGTLGLAVVLPLSQLHLLLPLEPPCGIVWSDLRTLVGYSGAV